MKNEVEDLMFPDLHDSAAAELPAGVQGGTGAGIPDADGKVRSSAPPRSGLQRDKSDPSVIVFSVIKRCQHPHFTQFFQKAKKGQPKTGGFRADGSKWFGSRRLFSIPYLHISRSIKMNTY